MTTFIEIFDDFVLPLIDDYRLDNLYKKDKKEVLYEYLRGFLISGLSDFDCIKPLTYHKEVIKNNKNEETEIYVFDYDLDLDEKKIIGEITFAKYFKRTIQDFKARMPYMSQREFKKEATAPVMKENDKWYNNIVSEYVQDIANYNLKHIGELDYWKDYNS